MNNKILNLTILTLLVTACGEAREADDESTREIHTIQAACGDMPWPEPGWTVTNYPGDADGRVCMSDADYVGRDAYLQDVRDWGRCVELEVCRDRGECV